MKMYARLGTCILQGQLLDIGQFLKLAAFRIEVAGRDGKAILSNAKRLSNGHLGTKTHNVSMETEWPLQAKSIVINCNHTVLKHFGTNLLSYSCTKRTQPTKKSSILPPQNTETLVNYSGKSVPLLTIHKASHCCLKEKLQFTAVQFLRTSSILNTCHLARGVMSVTPGNLILLTHRSFSKLSSDKNSGKSAKSQQITLQKKILVTCLFGAAVMGFCFYVHLEKKKQEKLKRHEQLKKLVLGQGDFNLLDHTGRPRTKSDFFGQWVLLYFGFTHCPDICPDEMEKMSNAILILDMDRALPSVQPIFITVDPERDGVKEMAKYIKDFHTRMIGLTGTPEQIKELGKAYRVYYSAGPKDEDNDYIVDHTIIIYLLNPDGLFIDYYNRSKTDQEIAESIRGHMKTHVQLFS